MHQEKLPSNISSLHHEDESLKISQNTSRSLGIIWIKFQANWSMGSKVRKHYWKFLNFWFRGQSMRGSYLNNRKVVSHQSFTGDSWDIELSNERSFENANIKTVKIRLSQDENNVWLVTPLLLNQLRANWCLRSGFIELYLWKKY